MYNNNNNNIHHDNAAPKAPIPDSHNFSNARGPTTATGTAATGASALPPGSHVPKAMRRRSSSCSSSSSSSSSDGENRHLGIDGAHHEGGAGTHSKHKPKVGDKVKGNLEKVSGKVTNNPDKVVHGENLAQGNQYP